MKLFQSDLLSSAKTRAPLNLLNLLSSPGDSAACGPSRARPLLLCTLAGLGLASLLGFPLRVAADGAESYWPQWRGPSQNGVASKASPPVEWGNNKNVKWKAKIPGQGSSTPVIWGDQVFVLTAVATGKKVETASSEAPDQNARPERPGRGPAVAGGPGGRGGFGGFGPGNMLGARMVEAGDANSDQKLSLNEMSSLAEKWFDQLDDEKNGRLSQEQFSEKLGALLSPPDRPGFPGGRGGGPGRFLGPGLFGATDENKDGTLTRVEFKSAFGKWHASWDSAKSGSLDENQLREGLNAALPRPQFGGPGGGPPGEGRGGRGGFGGFGGSKPDEVHQFVLLCLDRMSGQVRWQRVAREEVPHEGHHRSDGTFASSSPVTDGEHIYAYFGSRGLYCYDMAGNLKWEHDFGEMNIALTFGEGSSPALHGNHLVVNWDHEGDSFIAALDKRTGQTLWKKSREERTSWSTPVIVEHDGQAQVIVAATGKIRSYNLANGEVIWECSGLTPNVIPTPVVEKGIVYCMSGFRGNALLAIQLGRAGDLTGTDAVVWTHSKSTPYVPSPLLYDGKLYFFASNNGILSCFEAKTGKPIIDAERLSELQGVYASPVGANGHVYLVGRNGVTQVLKHSNQVEILATNRLDDQFDASPAVAGNELFLRGREHLYCLAEQ